MRHFIYRGTTYAEDDDEDAMETQKEKGARDLNSDISHLG
jgi:hypothetical protein